MGGISEGFYDFLEVIDHEAFANIMGCIEACVETGLIALFAIKTSAGLVIIGLVMIVNVCFFLLEKLVGKLDGLALQLDARDLVAQASNQDGGHSLIAAHVQNPGPSGLLAEPVESVFAVLLLLPVADLPQVELAESVLGRHGFLRQKRLKGGAFNFGLRLSDEGLETSRTVPG